ncbi:MAG: hypothetical protein JWM34_1087 [Ilumatobacteraceae bacterium]|nr:hypothetical protein [Ilumatobacteraceae bacterium]
MRNGEPQIWPNTRSGEGSSARRRLRRAVIGLTLMASAACAASCGSDTRSPQSHIVVLLDISQSVLRHDPPQVQAMAASIEAVVKEAAQREDLVEFRTVGGIDGNQTFASFDFKPDERTSESDARLRIWVRAQIDAVAETMKSLPAAAGGATTDLLSPIEEAARFLSDQQGGGKYLVVVSDMSQTGGSYVFSPTMDCTFDASATEVSPPDLSGVEVSVVQLYDGASTGPLGRDCVTKWWKGLFQQARVKRVRQFNDSAVNGY